MSCYWVIMANDYPAGIAQGSEAWAWKVCKDLKDAYIANHCGYGPNAVGPAADRARRALSERMYFRTYAFSVFNQPRSWKDPTK